jgi:hypothetical protein
MEKLFPEGERDYACELVRGTPRGAIANQEPAFSEHHADAISVRDPHNPTPEVFTRSHGREQKQGKCENVRCLCVHLFSPIRLDALRKGQSGL